MSQIPESALISVIVPVYNVSDFIGQCLDSLLEQDYPNLEIIIVNDGSTDDSMMKIETQITVAKNIKVIHQSNQGLSSARNAGIEQASGEYLVFVDSDDYLPPQAISKLYQGVIDYQVKIAIGSVCQVNEFGKGKQQIFLEKPLILSYPELEDYLYEHVLLFIPAWGKIYHHSIFKELRYPLGKIHEDEFITYRAYLETDKVAYLPELVYYYRKHEGSITARAFEAKKLAYLDALEERYQIFERLGYPLGRTTKKYSSYLRFAAKSAMRFDDFTTIDIVNKRYWTFFNNISVLEKFKHLLLYLKLKIYKIKMQV